MKTLIFVSLALISAQAFAANTLVERLEVGVEHAFAPPRGFDDNDSIQVVVHGFLPNTCFTLSESFVERADGGTRLIVHQFATRQLDGICAQDALLPEHLKMIVPFTTEINLGQLNAANYTVEYKKTNGEIGVKPMNVGNAKTTTVDSLPYASVQSAETASIVSSLGDVIVKLNGVLNSTCTELNSDVVVDRSVDVFVLLPTIKVKTGVVCAQVLVPFEKEVNLGKVIPGNHYLIHVRSMNGRAVNRVIEAGR